MLMTIKLGRDVAFNEEVPPITSHDLLVNWPYEVK